MSVGLALISHSYRRVRFLVLGAATLLAGFQILLCLAAKAAQELNVFGQLSALIPEFLRQLMGPALISLMSFSGIVCLGYFHFAVIGTVIGLGITITTEISAEIETRFVDLILSRPVARHWLVTRSLTLLIAASILLLLAMMLGTSAGLYLLAPAGAFRPTLRLIRSLALNLGALIACWGGVTLAITSFARRRSVAGAVAGLLALATYLFDYIAQVWKPAAKIAPFFPFHYYNALQLISAGGLPWSEVRVLLCFAGTGIVIAYLQFSRRDL
jgi:hypothetical protein